MANTDNVLEGQGPSLVEAADDDNGNQQPGSDVLPRSVNSVRKCDVLSWGQCRIPLRRPFNLQNHRAMEEPESPKKTTSESPVDSSRAPNPSDGPVPAVAEDSLATAEVKSYEGPAGWKGMGQNSINVSQKCPGIPSSLISGGIRFTSGDTHLGGNNARSYGPLPPCLGFCVPRGPPITGPPCNPTIASGIKMQQPPERKMAYNEGRAHVSFPLGGPRCPRENRPRPITSPARIGRFPSPVEVPRPPRPIMFPTRPSGFAPPPPSRDTGFPSWCKKRMEEIKK